MVCNLETPAVLRLSTTALSYLYPNSAGYTIPLCLLFKINGGGCWPYQCMFPCWLGFGKYTRTSSRWSEIQTSIFHSIYSYLLITFKSLIRTLLPLLPALNKLYPPIVDQKRFEERSCYGDFGAYLVNFISFWCQYVILLFKRTHID